MPLTPKALRDIGLIALLAGGCSSGGGSEHPQQCGLELVDSNSVPRIPVETIYDVRLNDAASDPGYIAGIGGIFRSGNELVVITSSSFVRASVDGTVLDTVPLPITGTIHAVKGDSTFGVTIRPHGEPLAQFCLLSPQGSKVSCELAISDYFGHHSPFYVFFNEVGRDNLGSEWFVDEQGQQSHDVPVSAYEPQLTDPLIQGLETGVVLTRLQRSSMCRNIKVLVEAENAQDALWENLLPAGYGANQTTALGESPDTAAVLTRADLCDESALGCDANESTTRYTGLLTLIDADTQTRRSTHSDLLVGKHVTWDGENFAVFELNDFDGYYRITQVTPGGTIVGTATWPTAFASSYYGRPSFAALAPNDYLIAFSVDGLDPQDRLLRVRLD